MLDLLCRGCWVGMSTNCLVTFTDTPANDESSRKPICTLNIDGLINFQIRGLAWQAMGLIAKEFAECFRVPTKKVTLSSANSPRVSIQNRHPIGRLFVGASTRDAANSTFLPSCVSEMKVGNGAKRRPGLQRFRSLNFWPW